MAGAMKQKQQGYRNGAAYGISEHLFVDVSHRMHMEVLTYCELCAHRRSRAVYGMSSDNDYSIG